MDPHVCGYFIVHSTPPELHSLLLKNVCRRNVDVIRILCVLNVAHPAEDPTAPTYTRMYVCVGKEIARRRQCECALFTRARSLCNFRQFTPILNGLLLSTASNSINHMCVADISFRKSLYHLFTLVKCKYIFLFMCVDS